MPDKLRSRLNYSNVTATVAVLTALGGTSYAVTFDRSLANCVVSATPGRGDPAAGGAFHHSIPQISMAGDTVTLSWENAKGRSRTPHS